MMEEDEIDQIRDPEEYVQDRRLRDIFDARADLRERRLTAREASTEDVWEATTLYRSAVSNYVAEVEPLLTKYDPGPEYLNEHKFGTVKVSLTVSEKAYRHGSSAIVVEGHDADPTETVTLDEKPPAVRYELIGLRSLFELSDPIRHQFELPVNSGRGTQKTVIRTEKCQIPFEILDRMARSTNLFLAEIGFELDPADDENEWEI